MNAAKALQAEFFAKSEPTAEELLDFCRKMDEMITNEKTSDSLPGFIGKSAFHNFLRHELWFDIVRKYLASKRHEYLYEIHREAHRVVFNGCAVHEAVVGVPTEQTRNNANIETFEQKYCDHYSVTDFSIKNRVLFWEVLLETLDIQFARRPEAIVAPESLDTPSPVWLPGARLNIVASCLRAGKGLKRTAIAYQRTDGRVERWTYGKLLKNVRMVAAGLRKLGLNKGDAVAMYMPMTPKCVAAYLGIIYAGCAVVSIADSLAAPEIERRARIAGAKAIITQDGALRGEKFLPLYDKVCEAGAPRAVVLAHGRRLNCRLREGDLTWEEFLAIDEAPPEICGAADAITILFSSGTTGDPKAIPWNHTTPVKCASDGYFHQDIHQNDVVAWPTNIGWMMGPWLIFATLINKATIALAEVAPNTAEFCKFVEQCRVTILGVVPSLVKKWRETGAADGCDWSNLRLLTSTGEASNYDDYFWLTVRAHYAPVIEYCGGTEIGGAYITSDVCAPQIPSHFTSPAAGMDFIITDEEGKPATAGEVLLIPHSIGLSTTLLNRDHEAAYFEGTPDVSPETETAGGLQLADSARFINGKPLLRKHGDSIGRLPNGLFCAHGRTDDTMNLGGIKVSSVEIENAVAGVEGMKEAAAVAITPAGGGPDLLVIFAVAPPETDRAQLLRVMQNAVSKKLNPLFRVHDVVVLNALPRTASNKIMRRTLRDEYRKK